MDPLDWTHQWDDFEMMMYADMAPEPGIYMQVSRKTRESGAEFWDIIYDRKIADLESGIPGEPGSEPWEEAMLRQHLNKHPLLVNDEKDYLAQFLANHEAGGPGNG